MKDESLCAATQEALKEEEERCRRLADREQQMGDSREVLLALFGINVLDDKSILILYLS